MLVLKYERTVLRIQCTQDHLCPPTLRQWVELACQVQPMLPGRCSQCKGGSTSALFRCKSAKNPELADTHGKVDDTPEFFCG